METMYDVPINRVNVEVNSIHVVHREKSVMVFKQIEIRANFTRNCSRSVNTCRCRNSDLDFPDIS